MNALNVSTRNSNRYHAFFLYMLFLCGCAAFEWSVNTARPEVDRRAIAGIWRLTPISSEQKPMKEFTVYPKKEKKQNPVDEGFLLMLKEDGSFQQYTADMEDDEDEEEDLNDSWSKFKAKEEAKQEKIKKRPQLTNIVKGVWDYLDGRLILAADRPEIDTQKSYDEPEANSITSLTADTLLEGKVVATYQTKLEENPALARSSDEKSDSSGKKDADKTTSAKVSNTTRTALDTHLSVPEGSIKIGKFFYPKNHPSFFEQPIYQPVEKGAFALKQILGSLNTAHATEEDEIVEKYQRSDFYNKTFLLTTQPLKQYRGRGKTQWSPKQGRFLEDPSAKREAAAAEEAAGRYIRAMQVKFFSNNTFATIGGMGDMVLRGKFSIVGQDMDQLWFKVNRFGFGRSVSGSVFSEGRMLTQDDAKAYWGYISSSSEDQTPDAATSSEGETKKEQKLEVKGSILDGVGLEPLPVAKFIMREMLEEDDFLLEEEDEEEEEDEDEEDLPKGMNELGSVTDIDAGESDGIDWTNKNDDTFQ